MANYFIINRPSNLIIGVIATSSKPSDTSLRRFLSASSKSLDVYYKLLSKNPDVLVDVGDLAARSEYLFDKLKENIPFDDEGKAVPQKSRYRTPEQIPEAPDRESLIFSWIASRPDADAYDLNDAFCMGMLSVWGCFLHEHTLRSTI